MSQLEIITIENFYDDPMAMCEAALEQDFHRVGSYPGMRTDYCSDDDCVVFATKLKYHLGCEILNPNYAVDDQSDEQILCWQVSNTADRTWIHHDIWDEFEYPMWAAVLYMTPDAPVSAGTGLYRHKETGYYKYNSNTPDSDFNHTDILGNDKLDEWEATAFIGNMFNRLVTYPGNLYHRNIGSFGSNKHDGRLTQIMFYLRGPTI